MAGFHPVAPDWLFPILDGSHLPLSHSVGRRIHPVFESTAVSNIFSNAIDNTALRPFEHLPLWSISSRFPLSLPSGAALELYCNQATLDHVQRLYPDLSGLALPLVGFG